MPQLILIRHGESEGNRARVFTHSPHVPITDTGRVQVQAAAVWVGARYRPARVVSSPFLRARQSADILGATLAVPVAVEDDLRERSYGSLAGRPYGTIRELPDYDPERYWLWCPPGGGETLVDVAARAGAALDRIVRTAPHDDVVVVSHGAVMMGLWRHVTGEWRRGKVARNAGIVLVAHEHGHWRGATVVEQE